MWLFLINVRSWPEQLKLKQILNKYHVLRDDSKQLVLNCKTFSYFKQFTHDIITQNTIRNDIIYFYRSHLASRYDTSIVKGEGVEEKSNNKQHRKKIVQSKKMMSSYKFFYVLFSVTQTLFPLGFS